MSTTYDFQSLSPEDFERLSRDLLAAEWNLPIETFRPGRDKGIDARYYHPISGELVIIQCKRYQPSAFSQLKNKMNDSELPKIEKLKPTRYVLLTAVSFAVGQKDELFELIKPWCKTPSDILGSSEINGLLVKHPNVVRAHFKLWLSSTVVLELIQNANIWNRTKATLQEIERELCRFVIHDGFAQASEILETHKHCIIVGLPGIGKTTMAKILLSQYVTYGYEAVVVSGDVEEVWSVATEAVDGSKKLVILYDDFLGQISFEHLKFEKNEEHRFLQLLKLVKNNNNLRFILTTREYILADAKRQHAVLEKAGPDLEQFTLTLEHYSKVSRARILFNHLFFSDLPKSRLEAIVNSKVYNDIIQHENYNPRTVESICQNSNFKSLSDSEYIERIGIEFNDPSLIWDHAFRTDIHPNSRTLLYILWTFGEYATLTALKKSFSKMVTSSLSDSHSDLFSRAIKELDGNFISSERIGFIGNTSIHDLKISYQNPSIRDYIDKRIHDDLDTRIMVCKSCVTFLQVQEIYEQTRANLTEHQVIDKQLYEFALQFIEAEDYSIVYMYGEPKFLGNRDRKRSERLGLLVQIGDSFDEHQRNFAILDSWIFSSDNLFEMMNWGSFQNISALVSILLNSPSLNDEKRLQFKKSFEVAIVEYLNSRDSVFELDNALYFLKENSGVFDTSSFNPYKKIEDIVKEIGDTPRERISITTIEDEVTALDSCKQILGEDFDHEFGVLNGLLDSMYEFSQSEEDFNDEMNTLTSEDIEKDFDIDKYFSGLISY
ncbi:restriction endonuclease [Methylophilus glucosoxydans]|uniref:Restriction endonuclease n=1 Tax=Methylophilus glucosoxydans TaxID=752553 RepID=A0ABW3GHN8_9PROT